MKKFLAAIVVIVLAVPLLLFVLSGHSRISVDPRPTVIAAETPVKIRIDNPHGIRRVTASIEQNGVRNLIFERLEKPSRLIFWRKRNLPFETTFSAGRKQAPGLKEGKAKLVIEAQSNDFRVLVDSIAYDIEVITAPPKVSADSFQHHINQGGCELVVFTVSGYSTESGARVGKSSFRSFPLPGSASHERFSLFVFPWDTPADTVPVVFARNPGMEATARFWHKVFPKKFRSRDLVIDDAFLEKVVNQIDPGSPGDLIARFLRINGEMRRRNNQTLADLRLKTEDRFLWTGPFLQLANSKVESQFADRRTYIYKGKKVDEQVHLGFDLSVTKNVAVSAANDGKVVYAADLGIYGNCVVVDHGYGLQSIYGHMSSIDVKPGDMVKKRQSLGKSGATGLAGGDHLHFSMQVDGVQVSPVEWWDEHWIHDRIRSKLAAQ